MDSERILSDQLATFSSYSAEWAEKAAREQSTAYRAYKSIIRPSSKIRYSKKALKIGFFGC
ncbi:MAG: hypothetical protein HYT63_01715 [Candidatus Yanofskybacteria bacterium]|nr:hypothetical protein [Candidatus Yanofskybacteria bacterium]